LGSGGNFLVSPALAWPPEIPRSTTAAATPKRGERRNIRRNNIELPSATQPSWQIENNADMQHEQGRKTFATEIRES